MEYMAGIHQSTSTPKERERKRENQVMKAFALLIQTQGAVLLKDFNDTSDTQELHENHFALFPS
jgi:hypothetical protein